MPQVSAFPDDEQQHEQPSTVPPTPEIGSRTAGLGAFPDEPDRLRDGLGQGATVGADLAARSFNLQLKTGLPVDVIRRNLDEVEREAAKADFDPVAFRARAPRLAGWIESQPLHGALVHDDIVPLTALESVLNFGANVGGSLAGGFLEHANMGTFGLAEAAGDVLGIPELTEWGKRKGVEAKAIGQQMRGPQTGVGRTGRAVLGGIESVGAAAPILVGSLLTKNPGPALALMGLQTAGPAYSEARGEGRGVGVALAFGAGQGAIEAATEKIPMGKLLGDIAERSGLLRTLANQVLSEVPGEQVATALQDLNEWAVLHPDKTFGSYLADRPGAFFDTLVSTIVATGVQTGAIHGLDRAIGGGSAKQTLTDLGDAVKQAKLPGRSADKFEEVVNRMAEGSPAATLYAPVDTFAAYWQEQGLDPAQVAAELTGSATAFVEAQQTGADLAIPVGRYATRIAGTTHNAFFANEIRLAPLEQNGREREAFHVEHAELLKQGAAPAAEPVDRTAGGADVGARVANMLEAQGVTPAVAEAYAKVHAAVFGSGLVARANLDPVQTFERYGLKVERSSDPQAARHAAARATGGGTAVPPAGNVTAAPVAPAGAETPGTPAGVQTPAAEAVPAGLEDVVGLADLLAGMGGASLTEATEAGLEENASGESDASLEALRRNEGMASRGERFVVYDRAGNERPLIGPEAVDYRPAAGETYGVIGPAGFRLLEDRGGRPPRDGVSSARGPETGQRSGDGNRERGRTDADRSSEGRGNGAVAQRRRLPSLLELGVSEGDTPFSPASEDVDAARFTPEHTRELERIADELEEFKFEGRSWHWLETKDGNAAGGNADLVAGGAGAPVFDDILQFSPLNKSKAGSAKQVRGTRAQIAAAIRKALESKRLASNLAEGAMRVAERRAADDYRDISRPMLPPSWGVEVDRAFTDDIAAGVDAEIERLELNADDLVDVGDPSFNPAEFEQRSAAAEPNPPTPQELEAWVDTLFEQLQDGLSTLVLRVKGNDLALESIGVKKGTDGYGTRAMRAITDYADARGLRIVLSTANRGFAPGGKQGKVTSGSARLREFYRRFDFIQNKGKAKDFSTKAELLRYPKAPEVLEQRDLFAGDEETVDTLDTGESQPRLPGDVGDVRELAIPLPEFEAPFALTAPEAGPERKRKATGEAQLSAEYLEADRAFKAAAVRYREATQAYRNREIGDAEFLEARRANEAASQAFDAAFEKEQDLNRRRGRATLFQEPQRTKRAVEANGAIVFGTDRKFSIKLFAKADLSTFLHESGHLFLEVFADVEQALNAIPEAERTLEQRQILDDGAVLRQWFGERKAGEEPGRNTTWTRAEHEKFARGFEAYLLEGKAPNEELRTVFSKFKTWLVGVYRSIRGLERAAGFEIEITPEIRKVFDRLVASERQMQALEQDTVPIFTTAADAGMSEAEFVAYREQVERAHLATREELDRRLAADVQRERSAQWKAERDAIEANVAEELNAAPIYRALAAMQRGTLPNGDPLIEGEEAAPMKLSRAMLVEQFGEARLKTLPRPYIYSAEGGVDPRLAAELFGFSSADAMLNELAAARPYAEVLEEETNRRMIAAHGDTLLDGTIIEARKQAAASEDREILIRAELRALHALQRQVRPQVRAAVTATQQAERAERDYERRWFEAEAKLRIAIAEGRKQVEIDALRAETRALREKARSGPAAVVAGIPNAEFLREAARVRIGQTRVEDIRADRWFAAARRASREAVRLAAAQDFAGAARQKTQELYALALYREARGTLERLEKRVDKARGLSKPAVRATLGFAGDSYLDQIDGLLDRYEFAKVSDKVLRRRASLTKWVAALEGEGLPVDLPDELLDEARRTNYRKLTVDELLGVLDGIDQILHLARLKNRLLKAASRRSLDDTAADLATSIRNNVKRSKRTVSRDRRLADERARLMDSFFGSHRKLASLTREMDGFVDGGPMWEAITRPLNEAGNREAEMNADATKRLTAIVEKAFPGLAKRALYEKVEIPSINRSLSRMERLMVALNWGNEGNRDRVRRFERWNDRQVQDILDTLDRRDMQFVQDTLDFLGSFRAEIGAKQKRVTGLEPEWVESTPIVTAAGTFPGGYFPLKYDDRLSAGAAQKLELEAANLAKQAAFVQATTRRGHTKARAATVKAPVRFDFGVIFEHTQQVIHDLTHHEALIDVGRILGHADVSAAVYDAYGDQVYKDLRAHVRDIAFGDLPAADTFERVLNHARAGATIVGLGWNVTTSLLQPLGLIPAIPRVGVGNLARGIGRWMRDAAHMESTVVWVHERSVFMRLRGQTQQREINEIRNAVGVNTGTFSAAADAAFQWASFGKVDRQAIADSYFFLIQRAQMLADIPVWLAAYEQAKNANEPDDRAVALADQAVLDTQGGGQVKDLASVQKGGPAKKLWTNFYSYFNVLYNQAVEARLSKDLKNPIEVGRLAVDYFLLFIAPASLGYAIRAALTSGGDDDDEGIVEGLARENASYLMGTVLGLRELSGAVQGYSGYEGPAGARAFATAGKLARQAGQVVESGFDPDTLDAAFWRALADSAGAWFHFPAGQVRKTIEGTVAIVEGKTVNPAAVLSGAPR